MLSTPTGDDVDAIAAAVQDPAIVRWTTVPSPYTRRDAEAFVDFTDRSWADGTGYTWVIRLDGALSGMISVHDVADGAGELGYWMSPHARGGGTLTAAARLVVDWSFSPDAGLRHLRWHAVVGNTASARVARRLGFRFIGVEPPGDGRDEPRWAGELTATDGRRPQPWPAEVIPPRR